MFTVVSHLLSASVCYVDDLHYIEVLRLCQYQFIFLQTIIS